MEMGGEEGTWEGLAYIGWKCDCEFLELFQLGADLDFIFFVEEDGEEGLGAAGILDDLVGEEEALRCFVVIGAVFGLLCLRLLSRIFEKEYHAINRAAGYQPVVFGQNLELSKVSGLSARKRTLAVSDRPHPARQVPRTEHL